MYNLDILEGESSIRIIYPSAVIGEKASSYLTEALRYNDSEKFSFVYPNLIDIDDATILLLRSAAKVIQGLDFLEKKDGGVCFTLVPVPLLKDSRGQTRSIRGIDFSGLGTSGFSLENNFLRIFSNWLEKEAWHEGYLLKDIKPGWYLFSSGTVKDFCNLAFYDQEEKVNRHEISEVLRKLSFKSDGDSIIAEAHIAYIAGCILSVAAETNKDIPIKKGFLRTRSFYYSGTRMGILGSSYGFDLDGFWAGDGACPNVSLAFCELVSSFVYE